MKSSTFSSSTQPTPISPWGRQPIDLTRLEEYQYTAIKNPREIRVLVLDPGSGDDEVSCSLQHVSLDGPPKFEALSYTWGDACQRRAIKCGEGILRITSNLHGALRELRHGDTERVLWADAICINQDDLDERAEQVKLMADIYSTGDRTLIWLGEDTGYAAEAFSTIEWIRQQFPGNSWEEATAGDQSPDLQEQVTRLKSSGGPDLFPAFKWELVERLLQNPWFRRKWIIQEAVKGKTPPLQWGRLFLDWHILEDAIMYLKVLGYKNLTVVNTWTISSVQSFNNDTFSALMKSTSYAETHGLSTLLYLARSFICSDPRDHLISLFGLACDIDQDGLLFQAHYKVPFDELFKHFVIWNIFEKRSLECFSSGRDQQVISPSWVPDFTSWNEHPTRPRDYMDFEATRDSELCATSSEDKMILSLKGKLLDQVAVLVPMNPTTHNDELDYKLDTTHGTMESSLSIYEVRVRQEMVWVQECRALALKGSDSFSLQRLDGFCRSMLWDTSIHGFENGSTALLAQFEIYIDCVATSWEERDHAWFARFNGVDPQVGTGFATFSKADTFLRLEMAGLDRCPRELKWGTKSVSCMVGIFLTLLGLVVTGNTLWLATATSMDLCMERLWIWME